MRVSVLHFLLPLKIKHYASFRASFLGGYFLSLEMKRYSFFPAHRASFRGGYLLPLEMKHYSTLSGSSCFISEGVLVAFAFQSVSRFGRAIVPAFWV